MKDTKPIIRIVGLRMLTSANGEVSAENINEIREGEFWHHRHEWSR